MLSGPLYRLFFGGTGRFPVSSERYGIIDFTHRRKAINCVGIPHQIVESKQISHSELGKLIGELSFAKTAIFLVSPDR